MARRLLFVSPRFLFPTDSGGKIRTTQILRGMKGGAFQIVLASPAAPGEASRFTREIESVSDRFVAWPELMRGRLFPLTRLRHLTSELPVPVATDRSAVAREIVASELARRPDVVVFDFAHTAVLAPDRIPARSVLFTHNVESEIFERHAAVAANPLIRAIWRNQYRKMATFEGAAIRRFDSIVAVAERDRAGFQQRFGASAVSVIPTAVDVDFFDYAPPGDAPQLIYIGSMDSMANIDAMHHFMDDVWPLIVAEVPGARMTVIGRAPPAALVNKARGKGIAWEFTGFVDDVRPHARGAAVHVVPLRVGGGTRIKVFEGLAMGVPMVSTTIGVEGLEIEPDTHYLRADNPVAFAAACTRLLRDGALRMALSRSSRDHLEANFTAAVAARAFERICLDILAGEPSSAPVDTTRVIRTPALSK